MKIHFVGIDGVSMSVLAKIMEARGNIVTGSDALRCGHNPINVCGADAVVYTNAVGENNVEVVEARKLGIPTIERAEMLGKIAEGYENVIAVSGAHGKTTTTGMLAAVMRHVNPTVHIGGKINNECGCQIGGNKFFITEACEYKRSFIHLKPNVAIILNIDYDHTDYYNSIVDVCSAFDEFSAKVDFGAVIVNNDDKYTKNVKVHESVKRITIGKLCGSDYYATCISGDSNGKYSFCVHEYGKRLGRFNLNISGYHNIYNALSVIACARFYKLSYAQIATALSEFSGIDRRFQTVGDFNGAKVISDYAHHPKEISASIETAKATHKKVIAIFQPHTYSRTQSMCVEFADSLRHADEVVLAPIFASRESPIDGISSHNIVRQLIDRGVKVCHKDTFFEIVSYAREKADNNTIILFMGAGDIDNAAHIMVDKNFYK